MVQRRREPRFHSALGCPLTARMPSSSPLTRATATANAKCAHRRISRVHISRLPVCCLQPRQHSLNRSTGLFPIIDLPIYYTQEKGLCKPLFKKIMKAAFEAATKVKSRFSAAAEKRLSDKILIILRNQPLQHGMLFFHIGNQLELCARAFEIVPLAMNAEVGITLQVIGKEPHALF